MSELDVAIGDAFDIMRGEDDLDAVVDVEPFGMMVHLLRGQGDLVHEAPGFAEIAEMKGFPDRVAILDFDPAMKLLECPVTGRGRQTLYHVALLADGLRAEQVTVGEVA